MNNAVDVVVHGQLHKFSDDNTEDMKPVAKYIDPDAVRFWQEALGDTTTSL